MDLFSYLREAISGPGAFRFILQPAVALFLAIRDGRRDARAGTRPFFERLLFEPWDRRALARNAIGTLLVPLCVAFALDSIFQLILTGEWRLIRAVAVGLLLVGIPYSLSRGLAARVFRVADRRKPRRVT